MKKIYVCAPISNNVYQNLVNASKYSEFTQKECDATPIVSHFFAFYLNMSTFDRELLVKSSLDLIWICDELWAFGDCIDEKMKAEIDRAQRLGITVKYYNDIKTDLIKSKYGGIKFERIYNIKKD